MEKANIEYEHEHAVEIQVSDHTILDLSEDSIRYHLTPGISGLFSTFEKNLRYYFTEYMIIERN